MKRAGIIIGVIIVIIIFIVLIVNLPKKNPVLPEPGNNVDNKYSTELKNLMDQKINHDKLISIEYINTGESNGKIEKIIVDLINLTIRKEYKDSFDDKLEIKEYSIKDIDINPILEFIEKYNFISWSKLPYDYDNQNVSVKKIILKYDNTKYNSGVEEYEINYNYKLPREGQALLNELKQKVNSLIVSTNLVSENTNNKSQK